MNYCECKTLTGQHDRWCSDHPRQQTGNVTDVLLKAAVDMSDWLRWKHAEENTPWPPYLHTFMDALEAWEKENP